MEIIISILGAVTAIVVAMIGAILSNKNNNVFQLRKLREDHYISYIESIHNLASDNKNQEKMSKYSYFRDKLFIVASEEVVKCILEFEEKAVGKESKLHDEYLTNIIKAIRKDLKIKDKSFPIVQFKK